MPLYEYKCDKCGKVHEKFQSMKDAHVSFCCGDKAQRIFRPTAFTDVYTGRYEPALRQYVGTKTQRRRLMREKNLIEYPYDD